jgi:glutamine synthetase
VDDIVLFRLMAREIALEYGIVLTFMPKPIAEAGGSGMHVNFSFLDEAGGNALSSGPKGGPEHMNELARGCLAGLVHHHKGLAGLIAPTANSYMRLQPGSLSGYWQNWGGDHRNVTTRISSEGGSKARLEHRMADASANPYTAVAAVLQAARLGVAGGYDLPPMETGDGFDRSDAKQGVADDLGRAVADLERDTALSEAVGAGLVANHVYMKRQEVKKTRDLEGDGLRDFYVWFI